MDGTGAGVLEGIGEDLLDHELGPFLIGEDGGRHGIHLQRDFLGDEHGSIFADCRFHDVF